MPKYYSQVHLQLVFVVKYREAMIHPSFQNDLYRYMTGIITNRTHKCLIINGMPDHVHLLIQMKPIEGVAELVQMLKGTTSKWINDTQLLTRHFQWQPGYGVFSYSKSHVPAVMKYIANQETHHKKQTFREEYLAMLTGFGESDIDTFMFPLLR